MKILLGLLSVVCGVAFAAPPSIILAKNYTNQNVENWLMSEKLDGVRAYWDGKRLISRQGNVFTPPSGFTQHFPNYPLDGELYSKRGQFEQISATVRANNGDWRGIKLHVFDVPNASGSLKQRLAVVEAHLTKYPQANLQVVPQIPVKNLAHAQDFLKQIERQGGEGVMLRNPLLPYSAGRSDGLLKLKSVHDAECIVTQHHEGKGKYTGKLGAVSCKNELGEFKIGTGFKDVDRENPPAIGSKITYKYRGFTKKGLPRFASYLRKR